MAGRPEIGTPGTKRYKLVKKFQKDGFFLYRHPAGTPSSQDAWWTHKDHPGYQFQLKDDGKVNVMHEKSKKVKKNVPYEKVLKSMFWTGWEKSESFDGGRVMTGNFREFMERAMNDPHYKKKVDEANPYSSGTSKQAQTKAKAMLELPAFKGVSDKKMAFAHLARTFDKLMRESTDDNEQEILNEG